MPFHPTVAEWDTDVFAGDPLGFPGYDERRRDLPATGESVRTGRTDHYAFIDGRFEVLGGTMGAAAGERVVRAYDRARDLRLPMVVATRTGGARLQEGMVALVQLARTAAAAGRHADAGLLSLGVYGSPTTGGVFASYGSLVDVRAAYEHAVIGFAGPRVAEGTLGVSLPARSHTAESAYDHGLVDELLVPGGAGEWVEVGLGLVARPLPTRPLPAWEDPGVGGAWGEVLRARAVGRPTGHRPGGEARLVVAGAAGDRPGDPGRDWPRWRGPGAWSWRPIGTTPAGARHPPGSAWPSGPWHLAGRLGLPVVTMVDTPGADPSPESEADGIAGEIARTFAAMAACPTPTVSVCVGEGGSGGALALSYADRLLVSEHAIFSVIAPEGAAAILERDVTRSPDVADRLKLSSTDLLDLGPGRRGDPRRPGRHRRGRHPGAGDRDPRGPRDPLRRRRTPPAGSA